MGRANRLSVIPAQYPVAVKNGSELRYTGGGPPLQER